MLKILSPVFEVVQASCPLAPEAREILEQGGFVLPSALASAVAKRQEEFRSGRYCALEAMGRLGGARAEIGIDRHQAPQWPTGFVGSIAHGHGRALAAVARAERAVAVGVDIEPELSDEKARRIKKKILTPDDFKLMERFSDWREGPRVTLVFVAKEAIYKCLRPRGTDYFGFEDASLETFDEGSGIFKFHLNKNIGAGYAQGWSGQGRVLRVDGWMYAGVEILRA